MFLFVASFVSIFYFNQPPALNYVGCGKKGRVRLYICFLFYLNFSSFPCCFCESSPLFFVSVNCLLYIFSCSVIETRWHFGGGEVSTRQGGGGGGDGADATWSKRKEMLRSQLTKNNRNTHGDCSATVFCPHFESSD